VLCSLVLSFYHGIHVKLNKISVVSFVVYGNSIFTDKRICHLHDFYSFDKLQIFSFGKYSKYNKRKSK
jgi:hypothetical protein